MSLLCDSLLFLWYPIFLLPRILSCWIFSFLNLHYLKYDQAEITSVCYSKLSFFSLCLQEWFHFSFLFSVVFFYIVRLKLRNFNYLKDFWQFLFQWTLNSFMILPFKSFICWKSGTSLPVWTLFCELYIQKCLGNISWTLICDVEKLYIVLAFFLSCVCITLLHCQFGLHNEPITSTMRKNHQVFTASVKYCAVCNSRSWLLIA